MDDKSHASALNRIANQFRRKLVVVLLTAGIARLILVAIILFALAAAADWAIHIPAGWRIIPLLVFVFALCLLAYASIRRPLRERWSDKELLAWLDRSHSSPSTLLDGYELSSAEGIEEKNDPEGRRLLEQAVAAMAVHTNTRQLIAQSFHVKKIRSWWLSAAASIVLVVVASVVLPAHTRIAAVRFFNPFASARWPHRTNIIVAPPDGSWTIPQGEALTVRASLSGVEIPGEVEMNYRTLPKGNWVRERLPVNEAKTQFRFPEIREPLDFYLSGGDDTTDTYHVRIIQAPSLEKIVVHLQSPSYSGVPERTRDGGDIEGLEGSRARIEFTSSTPLKSAIFTFDGEKDQSLPVTNGRSFTTEFMLTRSTSYSVKLVGESGFREARPERYEIRVRPDAPPEAQIVSPDREIEGIANASYRVRFNASDDFELDKVEFLYRLDSGPLTLLSDRVTGPVPVHCRTTSADFAWNLSQLNIPARDTVNLEYFVRAVDTNPTGRGQTESIHHHIRVLKPSLYRESLLVMAKALNDEALLAEKNQRQAYQDGRKFLSGAGTGEENDPTWQSMITSQTAAFDAGRAASAQLSLLLDRAAANRLQTDFMSARLEQIAQILRGVIDNQHANIARVLAAVAPRDAAQSTPAAMKIRRMDALKALNNSEDGQKRAALELQRTLILVFDWNDLQSAAVSGLRLYEQQEDCGRDTAAIAPQFIGKDIRDLSDADQEKLIILGKSQRVIYDGESVLEGHLEQILTKSERQRRQSIRVPIYAAYSELRNRRVKDLMLSASEAIKYNQPADILNQQKTALEALRVVKAGLEAAGAPEVLAAIPLSAEVLDIDFEDTKKNPDVVETLPPPPLVVTDRQGTDPLTTAIINAGDAVRDVVRRSEYLADHHDPADLPRFQRLRFGRLLELATQTGQSLSTAVEAAEKANEPFARSFLTNLGEDFHSATSLIAEKDITPGARQISADAAQGLTDTVELLASRRAVLAMKDEHDHQNGIDPFKRPYELQGADLAATTNLINGMLQLRLELRDAGRALERLKSEPQKTQVLLGTVQSERRARLRAKEKELSAQLAELSKALSAISDKNRVKVAGDIGDLLSPDICSSLADPPGHEAQRSARAIQDAARLAQSIQQLRDLMDARGVLAPPVVVDAPPPPEQIAHMTEEQYAKTMSLPVLRERIAHMSQLSPALRQSLSDSLSHDFPAEQQRFLAAYVNAILAAAKEENP